MVLQCNAGEQGAVPPILVLEIWAFVELIFP